MISYKFELHFNCIIFVSRLDIKYYTCCLYPLTNSIRVDPPITVMITPNLNEPLMVGQIGCTLTCDVSGADNLNPTITYQWTRDDGSTQTLVGTNSNTLTLSPLRLSNTGDYTCSVTVSSTLLNNDIMMSASNPQKLMVQSE